MTTGMGIGTSREKLQIFTGEKVKKIIFIYVYIYGMSFPNREKFPDLSDMLFKKISNTIPKKKKVEYIISSPWKTNIYIGKTYEIIENYLNWS